MLIDSQQRKQAVDPEQSLIVQAPAGSGKTELLTQRFLRLLARVEVPEQIIALTFTRKAANEMRERILKSLTNAANSIKAESPHQLQTLTYAQDALKQNENRDWQLLQQPSRLKIMTIDALCQSITYAIPLQEQQISFTSISDKPHLHYKNAAYQCVQFALHAEEYQKDLQTLLLHLDNRQDLLIELLSHLLETREQWVSALYQGREQDKSSYEEAIAFIEQHELKRLTQSIPATLAEELVLLARQVAEIEANPDSPRYCLNHWYQFEEIDGGMAKGLASLLLTSTNQFRKGFDHHVGLKKGACSDPFYKELKTASQNLFHQLQEHPDFLQALIRVKDLPPPHYDNEQWDILNALFKLLPLLLGHLRLLFSQKNEVDFTEISQQALQALGTAEQPTDLALYFDHAIHHLLVDEFQDTSISQFQLITQLVQGWVPGDGKTLFVVGDPMQSIYRFRQAEVGLFIKAQQEGIGPVPLTPLQLQCNFRSTANIVNWVNQQFQSIFPEKADIESGAVSFCPAQDVLGKQEDSGIYAWQTETSQEEAWQLIKLVKQTLKQPSIESIAILVRSRTQLTEIIRQLREHQISYQGIEIDLLANAPVIRDIWTLTKALLLPGNRLAWLALLRSPYVGLELKDLHLIATANLKRSVYLSLAEQDSLIRLSDEGKRRCRYLYKTMHGALNQRQQGSLSEWIYQVWKQLKGELILSDNEQSDLEQFWMLLDQFEEHGQLPDIGLFEEELNKLYSKQVTPSKLQVMTIHKSKGLEFDCIILPGLSSASKNSQKPLLRWLKLPAEQAENLLLMSPIKGIHQDKCGLYDYLGRLDGEKDRYELQRLLYVAVTRAKKTLHLLDHSDKAHQGSFRSLLQNQPFQILDKERNLTLETSTLPQLYKLPIELYNDCELPLNEVTSIHNTTDLTLNDARIVGIVMHRLLQWICDEHLSSYEKIPWSLPDKELARLGFDSYNRELILKQLKEWMKRFFKCPVGQWIMDKHPKEHNEYELLISKEGQIQTRIIDRLFEIDNTLWIIDFKTGAHTNESLEKHKNQVNEYAQLMSESTSSIIHCGLYYLQDNQWICWEYQRQFYNS